MRCPARCAPLAIALLGVAGRHAFAQPTGKADPGPTRCIFLPNLARTDVIDDRTIVFHMRDGTLYLNHLSRKCPGLKREKRFMYSPTSSQLCAIDGVTVIEKWAFGFTRGFTCSLGEFNPITRLEYDSLMHPGPAGGVDSAIPVRPTEPQANSAPSPDAPGKAPPTARPSIAAGGASVKAAAPREPGESGGSVRRDGKEPSKQ